MKARYRKMIKELDRSEEEVKWEQLRTSRFPGCAQGIFIPVFGTLRASPLQVRRADLCHVCRGPLHQGHLSHLEAFLKRKYGPQRVSLVTRKALEQDEAFRKRRIERGPFSKRGKDPP